MSVVSQLNPHGVFAGVLDGKVEVHTSATASHPIRAYKYGKQPNKGLGDEFIVVRTNGVTQAKVRPLGLFSGTLAVTVYCKLQTDNTAKEARIAEILSQVEDAANSKAHGSYFYCIDADNVLQDTSPDTTSGYSTTAINVKWRTTETYQQELQTL